MEMSWTPAYLHATGIVTVARDPNHLSIILTLGNRQLTASFRRKTSPSDPPGPA